LVGYFIDHLVRFLIGLLVGRLFVWSVSRSVGFLVGQLFGWLVGRSVGCFVVWFS